MAEVLVASVRRRDVPWAVALGALGLWLVVQNALLLLVFAWREQGVALALATALLKVALALLRQSWLLAATPLATVTIYLVLRHRGRGRGGGRGPDGSTSRTPGRAEELGRAGIGACERGAADASGGKVLSVSEVDHA